jgi:hypothetical protein
MARFCSRRLRKARALRNRWKRRRQWIALKAEQEAEQEAAEEEVQGPPPFPPQRQPRKRRRKLKRRRRPVKIRRHTR